ncbi:multicopper oxidase family protein [Lentzea sp. NPDC058436]|uniref:multicopper oxidase family protein n=1 Tax=Lentzea sp. NPDC058436 TaxID=3346499 RepID=UPI003658388E
MNGISRRTLLGAGITGLFGVGVGTPLLLKGTGTESTGSLLRSERPPPVPFARRLTIPEVLKPFRSDVDGDHYRIVHTAASASILPGVKTRIWGYNGIFPGPTIESRRGRPVIVTHVNQLPVPTVVHLHGGHTPASSDGYPVDFINPLGMVSHEGHHGSGSMIGDVTQGSREYVFPLDQRAAALWYHDHRMDFTGPSVWRGLAGFHLHRDDEEDALRLPSGARELPLMITDRSFAADGSFLYPSIDPSLLSIPGVTGDYVAGVLGDTMLVNGSPWPIAEVEAVQYRLRFLNACNARRLSLRLDPAPAAGFAQIGTDGGLLESPIHHDHLELAPAQRMDVIVDFSAYSPGTKVTILNDFDSGPMSQVMQFVVGQSTRDDFTLPARLSSIERLTAAQAVTTRSFAFRAGDVHGGNGWLIGERAFSSDHIAADPLLGTVEVWRLRADFHHPVHLHLNPFQVLSRGSEAPGPFDAGWKDTVDIRPAEEVAIAIRFDGYRGKYVFHCHNLEHEDMAMMANFEVR